MFLTHEKPFIALHNPEPTPRYLPMWIMSMSLTPKQQRCCKENLVDLNATAAAERAGYHRKMAAKLVAKCSIQTQVRRLKLARSRRTIRAGSKRGEVGQRLVTKSYVADDVQRFKEERSRRTGDSVAARLVNKSQVFRLRCKRSKEERSRRTGMDADRVLQELAIVAFTDISDSTGECYPRPIVGRDRAAYAILARPLQISAGSASAADAAKH